MYKKNLKVLIIEPASQLQPHDKARPNGTLGPAYILGSLRRTEVPGEKLTAAVKDFWLELNPNEYTKSTQSINLSKSEDKRPYEH